MEGGLLAERWAGATAPPLSSLPTPSSSHSILVFVEQSCFEQPAEPPPTWGERFVWWLQLLFCEALSDISPTPCCYSSLTQLCNSSVGPCFTGENTEPQKLGPASRSLWEAPRTHVCLTICTLHSYLLFEWDSVLLVGTSF